jgi:hypothetical protein
MMRASARLCVALVMVVLAACGPGSPQEQAFQQANAQLTSYRGSDAFGNTDDARARAAKFSKLFGQMRELLFTKARASGAPSLSQGHFITHCEMRPGRVAFLVHVPDLRKFTAEAQDQLFRVAWAAAQAAITDLPREKTELGVGLRGALIYGEVGAGPASVDKPTQRSESSTDLLLPFFTGAVASATAATPSSSAPAASTADPATAGPRPAESSTTPRPIAAGAQPNMSFGPDAITLAGTPRQPHPSVALFNAWGHGLAVAVGDGVWVSAQPMTGVSIKEAVDTAGITHRLVPFIDRGCEVYYRDETPAQPAGVATAATMRRGGFVLYGLDGGRPIETALEATQDRNTRGVVDTAAQVTRADLGRLLFDRRGRLAGVVCLQDRRYTLRSLGDVPAVLAEARERDAARRRDGFTLPSPTTLFVDRF